MDNNTPAHSREAIESARQVVEQFEALAVDFRRAMARLPDGLDSADMLARLSRGLESAERGAELARKLIAQ